MQHYFVIVVKEFHANIDMLYVNREDDKLPNAMIVSVCDACERVSVCERVRGDGRTARAAGSDCR